MQSNTSVPTVALQQGVPGRIILSAVAGADLTLTVNHGPLTGTVLKVAQKVKSRLLAGTTVTVAVEDGTAVELVDSSALQATRGAEEARTSRIATFSGLLFQAPLQVKAYPTAGKHFNGSAGELVDALGWYLEHRWVKIDGVDEHYEFSVTILAPGSAFHQPGEKPAPTWTITGKITAIDLQTRRVSIDVWHFGPSTATYK